jgi:hypothetical protein
MKKFLPLLISTAICGSALAAPIDVGPGSLVYSQNFDALAIGTNNNVAATTWSDDLTIPGWWFYHAGPTTVAGLAGANSTYYVSDGAAPPNTAPLAHGFYSLGLSANTDRSMGLCPTTNLGELSAIVIFHNTTAGPLKLSHVKFTAQAFRANSAPNTFDSMFVWWKTAPASADLLTNTTAACTTNTTQFVVGTNTTGPAANYITGWTNLPEYTYISTKAAAGQITPPDSRLFDSAPSLAPVIIPAGQFLAIRWSDINDGGTDAMLGFDDLELTFEESAPPVVQKVTAAHSPIVTFTPAPVGSAAYYPPGADVSELGWSGGAPGPITTSNVQVQPSQGAFTGTAKYWHLTTPSTTFTTDAVDVSELAGQTLQGRIELALYTTSGSGLEPADVLNARMEVALDGDFANTAAGNILTATFVDEPGTATDVFGATIPAAATYINLTAANYPASDFVFHPFVKTIDIPAGAAAARARILFSSGLGISNTEHVLLDNVKFSLAVVLADADADGMPDIYEQDNGLDPNSNADRDTDLDGDGQSNYLEYVAGTRANDPASALKVLASGLSATNEISLTWASVAGIRYQAQVSPDLGIPTVWLPLGAATTATGATTSIPAGIILPAGNPRYVLRIAVVP